MSLPGLHSVHGPPLPGAAPTTDPRCSQRIDRDHYEPVLSALRRALQLIPSPGTCASSFNAWVAASHRLVWVGVHVGGHG
jgi:hypothetical protein